MQTAPSINYQKQIDEALKRAKLKKVLYLYDELGYKRLIGVFNPKRAEEIKRELQRKNLINRLTEAEIKTTQPDDDFQ